MWITNLTGNKATEYQFYIAGLAAVFWDLSFTLPKCKPQRLSKENAFNGNIRIRVFKLFADYKMASLFFLCF
jgi:NHS family xanthosine MFS transporter